MKQNNEQAFLTLAKKLPRPLDIVVTRPEGRQQTLMEQLTRQTCQDPLISIHHCPLITIELHQQPLPTLFEEGAKAANISVVAAYHGVIFVSGQAILYAKQQLSPLQWRFLLSQPLYCVGSQSAQQLQHEVVELGLDNPVYYPNQMNSEGLLKLISPKLTVADRWLIIRGITGRDYLQKAMQACGVEIAEWQVYQSKPPSGKVVATITQLANREALWLVTSQQALMHLLGITGNCALRCPLIVSSDRIALTAEQLGFKNLVVAKDATNYSLTAAVAVLLNAISSG